MQHCFNQSSVSTDPDVCGNRINIGYTIEGIPNQAFVLLTQEPFTAFRTFVINSTSLGLSILWIITSVFFMSKYQLVEDFNILYFVSISNFAI